MSGPMWHNIGAQRPSEGDLARELLSWSQGAPSTDGAGDVLLGSGRDGSVRRSPLPEARRGWAWPMRHVRQILTPDEAQK
jgi:hypothetical protein